MCGNYPDGVSDADFYEYEYDDERLIEKLFPLTWEEEEDPWTDTKSPSGSR